MSEPKTPIEYEASCKAMIGREIVFPHGIGTITDFAYEDDPARHLYVVLSFPQRSWNKAVVIIHYRPYGDSDFMGAAIDIEQVGCTVGKFEEIVPLIYTMCEEGCISATTPITPAEPSQNAS